MALDFKVNSSLNSTVSIYVINNVTIDWGDGSPLETSIYSINHTCVYSITYYMYEIPPVIAQS